MKINQKISFKASWQFINRKNGIKFKSPRLGCLKLDKIAIAVFLSGKRLLTTKSYHDLFRSESAPGTEGVGVRDITILFTDLKGSTAMYDRIGDLRAFSLVRTHFAHLEKAINHFEGVQVKTIGDAIMAAFSQPENALKAAVEMIEAIRKFNETLVKPEEIRLKIGIHRGNSIVVSQNDRLDYFGQTVNVAARVQGLADADEIYLSEEVYRSKEVQEQLQSFHVNPENAKLKGVQEEWKVFRFKPC
ncbi:MAG: adenylate/guanylate cyclase domain-containing protein [Candidatus Riflebacteria bacterium]|nr:adenylate/guanylate cyclase domain-containing protein [Candidatus Riflebacteria bacterium]